LSTGHRKLVSWYGWGAQQFVILKSGKNEKSMRVCDRHFQATISCCCHWWCIWELLHIGLYSPTSIAANRRICTLHKT